MSNEPKPEHGLCLFRRSGIGLLSPLAFVLKWTQIFWEKKKEKERWGFEPLCSNENSIPGNIRLKGLLRGNSAQCSPKNSLLLMNSKEIGRRGSTTFGEWSGLSGMGLRILRLFSLIMHCSRTLSTSIPLWLENNVILLLRLLCYKIPHVQLVSLVEPQLCDLKHAGIMDALVEGFCRWGGSDSKNNTGWNIDRGQIKMLFLICNPCVRCKPANQIKLTSCMDPSAMKTVDLRGCGPRPASLARAGQYYAALFFFFFLLMCSVNPAGKLHRLGHRHLRQMENLSKGIRMPWTCSHSHFF